MRSAGISSGLRTNSRAVIFRAQREVFRFDPTEKYKLICIMKEQVLSEPFREILKLIYICSQRKLISS